MRDFVRRGGQYGDNTDGDLFNNFFGDHLDRGNTKWGVTGKEGADQNEQRREEIEAMSERWNRDLQHCSVSYEEYDGNEDEVEFYWDASMGVDFSLDLFIDPAVAINYEALNRGKGSLKDVLGDHYFYTENEIGMNSYNGHINFYIDISDSDVRVGGPDEFNAFCRHVSDDWDDKYDEIVKIIRAWLLDNEYMHPTPARVFFANDSQAQFRNFAVEWDDDGLSASAEADIGASAPLYQGGDVSQFSKPVEMALRELVFAEVRNIIQRQKSTSGYLPGFAPKPPKREFYDTNKFSVSIKSRGLDVKLQIAFTADDVTTQEELDHDMDLLRMVDQLFPRIVQECQVWLGRYAMQIEIYIRQRDEKIRQLEEDVDSNQPDPPFDFQFDPRQARRRTAIERYLRKRVK
jgi:hypothetical protein